jgi:transposase
MNDKQLYQNILGVVSPWEVTSVQLDLKGNRVTVYVEHDPNKKTRCPVCNKESSIYDHNIRRWRHLDTCQMTTIIECDIPRVSCNEHGVKQLQVPWAESNSHFTALFEALAINWLKETSISAVAKLLCLSWEEAAGIQERAVRRGLARREEKALTNIAIDETSFQKRHEYVTVINDKDSGHVIDVLDDRKSETLETWLKQRPKEHIGAIKTVSMDMWDPFIKAITETVPNAHEVICFDRFHVAQHFGKAMDKVRAQEHRALLARTGKSILTGTKFKWLSNSSRIDNRSRRDFMELTRMTLKTARAWAIKELASGLWNFSYRASASKAWDHLVKRISRCRLEPVIKVGRMVRKYLWGILNAVIAKASNATAEAKNGRIQWIKKMACGFRSRKRFRMAILFHLGGLNLMPETLANRV